MRSSSGLYLYRRSNGRYYIGRRIDGKLVWRSTGATTKGEALKAFREEKRVPRRIDAGRFNGDVRLSAFAERLLGVIPQILAKKTVEIYRRTLNWTLRISGDRSLAELSGEHWDAYRSERMKSVAPMSVNQELRVLRAMMNTAVRWGYLDVNPFSRERFVPVPETLPVYFSRDELIRLLADVDEPVYRDIFLFAALTGCRRGEILNLRWEDFDERRGVVTVHSSLGFRTKTRRIRCVPLHNVAIQILSSRRSVAQETYVFTQNGRQLTGNNVSRRLRFHVRRALLRRELHFHSLRHGFASWLIQAGESLYTVQKLLGHTSPRMTQVYSHLEGSDLRDSVSRITIAGYN